MIEPKSSPHSVIRAACKCIAVFLGVSTLLIGALGRLELTSILWAAAPLVCIWLLDTGYVAADMKFEAPASAGDGDKNVDDSVLRINPIARYLQALGSLTAWPFYFVLFAIVFAGGRALPKASLAGYPSQFPMTAAGQQFRQGATNPAVRTNVTRPIQTLPRAANAANGPARPGTGVVVAKGVQPMVHQSAPAATPPAPAAPTSAPPTGTAAPAVTAPPPQ